MEDTEKCKQRLYKRKKDK